jgi:predicted metal-dependent peptidase
MGKYLDQALLKLYTDPNDRYYSYLFFQVDRVHDPKIPTMAVGLVKSRLTLLYNETFNKDIIDKHGIDALITILKHEALHITNKHLSRKQGNLKCKSDSQLNMIAEDVTINQYLNNDHINNIGGVTLDRFNETLQETKQIAEPYMSKEYYFGLLKNERDEQQKNGKGDLEKQLSDLEMDDHSNHEAEMDQLEESMIESMINKSIDNARKDGCGKLPANIEELIKISKKPKVSWERELKHFVGQTNRSNRTLTRSRRNRRYGIKVQGSKKDYTARILTVVDTSGSMGNERIDKALNELYGIYKGNNNITLDIVECDAAITEVFTYNGEDEFNIKGRGGTNMTPALDYAKEHKYDGVIVLTDGEFYETFESNYPVPSLWVIMDNDYKCNIGKTINLKDY